MAKTAAWEEEQVLGEQAAVLRWRAEQFRDLGFAGDQASELAASKADLGQARYLLGSGCSPDLAFRILL
jgi:hypothetical protein